MDRAMHLYKRWALFLTLWTGPGYGYSPQELQHCNIRLDVARKTALLPITASILHSGSYCEINFGTTEFNPITVTLEQEHYRLNVDGDRYTVLLPHVQPPMPGSVLPAPFVPAVPAVSVVPAVPVVPVVPPPVPPIVLMDASGHIDTLSKKTTRLQQETERLIKTNQALEQQLQKQSNQFKGRMTELNRQLSEATRSQQQNENPAQRQDEPEPSEPPEPPEPPEYWPEVPSTVHIRTQGTQTPTFHNRRLPLIQILRRQIREQSRQISQLSKALDGKERALAASQEAVRELNLKLFKDSEQYEQSERRLLEQIDSIKSERPLPMSPTMGTSPAPPLAEEAGATEEVAAEKTAKKKKKGRKKGKKSKASSKNEQYTGDDSSATASTELNDNSFEPEVGEATNTSHSDKLQELREKEARILLGRLSTDIPALKLAEIKGKKRLETQNILHDKKGLDDYMTRLFKLKEEHSEINLDQHFKALVKILQDQIKRSIRNTKGIYQDYLEDAINRHILLFINFRRLHEEENLWRVMNLLTSDKRNAIKINVLNTFRRLLKESWSDLRIGLWQVLAQTYVAFHFENRYENEDDFHDYLSNLVYALFAEDFTMITTMVHGLKGVDTPHNYGLRDHVRAFVKGNDDGVYNSTGHLSILQDFQMIEYLMDSIADNASRGNIWSEFDVTVVTATIVKIYSSLRDIKNLFEPTLAQNRYQMVQSFHNDESEWNSKCHNILRRANLVERLKKEKPHQSRPGRLLSQFQTHLTEYKEAGRLNVLSLDPIERYSTLGLVPNYTPGDGHCLFHALTQQLSGVKTSGQQDSQRFIRQLIEFAQKQSDYSDTFGHISTELQEGEDLNSLNAVVNQLLNAQSIESPIEQESWGGHEILGLVSSYLNSPVLVIQANHTMSGDGSIALLFEPGEREPGYLNFIETLDCIEEAFWNNSMPVILGFLQGNPHTGVGNHWFELTCNTLPETSSDLYEELPDLEVSDCDRDDNSDPEQCLASCPERPVESQL